MPEVPWEPEVLQESLSWEYERPQVPPSPIFESARPSSLPPSSSVTVWKLACRLESGWEPQVLALEEVGRGQGGDSRLQCWDLRRLLRSNLTLLVRHEV